MNNEALRANRAAILRSELRELYTLQLRGLLRYHRITLIEFWKRTELCVFQFLYFMLKFPLTRRNKVDDCVPNDSDFNPND